MPVLEYRPRSLLKPRSRIFEAYRRDVTSQGGEDGVIERLFTVIPPIHRFCVEFGAWDGKLYSNTWSLLNMRDWSGVLIEGVEQRFRALEATYSGASGRVRLNNCYVTLDGPTRLDRLLAEAGAPVDFDLLSIDIDGNDWHVWQSLNDFHPRVVIVEFNPTIENDILFVQDPDPLIHQGCSLLALVELGKQKGYELCATTEVNAFFIERSLFSRLGIADNDIDALHQPRWPAKIFHGYDGTFFAVGATRLIWHDTALTQEDYQVLPTHMRFFRE